MTEKRYYSVDYDEEYYIFDSTKISKEEVLEKAEYSYDVFGESLMEDDVVNLLNENERLKKERLTWLKNQEELECLSEENKELKEKIEFKNCDNCQELLKKLEEENEQLKETIKEQLETALTLPFIRKEYCNALLRILGEEDSVESAKQYVIDFLGD